MVVERYELSVFISLILQGIGISRMVGNDGVFFESVSMHERGWVLKRPALYS